MTIRNKKDVLVFNFVDIEQLYIYFEAFQYRITLVRYGIVLCGTILT